MNKKIIRLLLITTIICIGMTGCVSKDDYAALEERVTALENEVASLSSSNIASDISNNDVSSEDIIILDEGAAIESNGPEYLYSLDNLSTQEKIDEIKGCLANRPYKGETYEEYINNFKNNPIIDEQQIKDGRELDYKYYLGEFLYNYPEYDIITSVTVNGIYPQMDGTIGYAEDFLSQGYISIKVNAVIHDYDEAVELYDHFYDYLSPNYIWISNNKDGSNWSGNGSLQTNPNNYAGVGFVSLSKGEGYYDLTVTYAYVPE